MESTDSFYSILFDADDFTCFAKNAKGSSVYHHSVPLREKMEFFSVNALNPKVDNNPTEDYHYLSTPRRADANVVKFRNFLVEMDGCSLSEQKRVVKECGFPWSTAVFSGNKSIHFIMCLETPVSRDEYLSLWKSVDAVFKKFGSRIDPACKNPSRLSRCANSVRDNGNVQECLKVRSRVPNEDFVRWLSSHSVDPSSFVYKPSEVVHATSATDAERYAAAKRIIGKEFESGSRHYFMNCLAGQCCRCGIQEHNALSLLSEYERKDFDIDEIRKIVKCMYQVNIFGSCQVLSKEEWRERRLSDKIDDLFKNNQLT